MNIGQEITARCFLCDGVVKLKKNITHNKKIHEANPNKVITESWVVIALHLCNKLMLSPGVPVTLSKSNDGILRFTYQHGIPVR